MAIEEFGFTHDQRGHQTANNKFKPIFLLILQAECGGRSHSSHSGISLQPAKWSTTIILPPDDNYFSPVATITLLQ